jgi:hypothetical protein
VIVTEYFPSDRQRLSMKRLGALVEPFILINTPEFREGDRDIFMLWSQLFAPYSQRPFELAAGAVVIAAIRQDHTEVIQRQSDSNVFRAMRW